jgi:hypothetical protein
MNQIATVVALITIVCGLGPLSAQVAPTGAIQPCGKRTDVGVRPNVSNLPLRVPTEEEIKAASGPQLVPAPSFPSSADPCAGFRAPQGATPDSALLDEAKDKASDALKDAALSRALQQAPELPVDNFEEWLTTASRSLSYVLPKGAKGFLQATLPELLSSPWLNAGTGILLNSSSTQTPEQDLTGRKEMIYHSLLDAARQLNTYSDSLGNFNSSGVPLLSAACQRLTAALADGGGTLNQKQSQDVQMTLSICQQTLAGQPSASIQGSLTQIPTKPPAAKPNPSPSTPCPVGAKRCL